MNIFILSLLKRSQVCEDLHNWIERFSYNLHVISKSYSFWKTFPCSVISLNHFFYQNFDQIIVSFWKALLYLVKQVLQFMYNVTHFMFPSCQVLDTSTVVRNILSSYQLYILKNLFKYMYFNNILFILVGMPCGVQCSEGRFLFKCAYKSVLCLWQLLLWTSMLSFSVGSQMSQKVSLI